LLSCSSAKNNYTNEDLESIKELVFSKHFSVTSEWAYPQASSSLNSVVNAGLLPPGNSANQISLVGNSNYLTIKGDSIQAQLPYFGERQLAATYGSQNAGIILDGIISDLTIQYNEKKNSHELRFQANQETETYQINMSIFPNKYTYMNINSTHRNTIAYRGEVKLLE